MKVRFYCDIPSHGVRLGNGIASWSFWATSTPGSTVPNDYTRVAFDVDMPPSLVMPMHDVVAPANAAVVTEVGEASK